MISGAMNAYYERTSSSFPFAQALWSRKKSRLAAV
jgi:hypothetical protein